MKTVSFCLWLFGAGQWSDCLFFFLIYSQKTYRRTGFGNFIR